MKDRYLMFYAQSMPTTKGHIRALSKMKEKHLQHILSCLSFKIINRKTYHIKCSCLQVKKSPPCCRTYYTDRTHFHEFKHHFFKQRKRPIHELNTGPSYNNAMKIIFSPKPTSTATANKDTYIRKQRGEK